MKTRGLICGILFLLYSPISSQEITEKALVGLGVIKIDLKGYEDEKKMEKLGEYFVVYKGTGTRFKNVFGEEEEAIEFAYIVTKIKNEITILGEITKDAIYDSSGNIIKSVHNNNLSYPNIVGISPDILIDPFGVGMVIRSNDGKVKKTNSFCLLKVDVSTKTIYEHFFTIQ